MDDFFNELFGNLISAIFVKILFSRFGVAVGGLLLLGWGFSVWEAQPRTHLKDLQVLHNVSTPRGKGMRMLLDMDTAHILNRRCKAIAYFYYSNGNKVRSSIVGYRTFDGQLSASTGFQPRYEYSVYNNLKISIPYKYFRSGNYKARVRTYCGKDFFGNTKTYSFKVWR